MKQRVSIIPNTDGKGTYLIAPYHPQLPRLARRMGATWDAGPRVWTFKASVQEQAIRDLCARVYGEC